MKERTLEALKRFNASQGPRKLGSRDGKVLPGVRFMTWAEETGGGFSLLEHPIPPHTLAAPLHRHSREDEYSFVLEGRMGALLGDDIILAEAGELAFKPRDQWHAFWNPDPTPCRILEIISPGGFERFFDELPTLMSRPGFNPTDITKLGKLYGLEFKPESVPKLCADHGLNGTLLRLG